MTPNDASKMTPRMKKYCESLTESQKNFLDRMNREKFHRGPLSPKNRMKLLSRTLSRGGSGGEQD
jgi:hypothetical protein